MIAGSALFASGQRLAQGSKPRAESVPGFSEAFCSELSGKFRVCKVKTTEGGDAEYVVENGSATTNKIPAPYWMSAGAPPDGFFTYRGDLDVDGRPEVVLVSLEGVSNGMGVTYSTAYIFDGASVGSSSKPISFSLQEFGASENFIFDRASQRTEILISYWAEYSSIEPKRRPGVYLVGKWFRYRAGKLEPVLEKPTLARRLLNSFAAERDNTWFENRRPFTWLKDRRTHKLFREPDETTQPVRTETGTISKFIERPSENDAASEFEFTTGSGTVIKGKLRGDWKPEDGKALEIKAIGLWKERYLYPLSWSMDFSSSAFLDRVEGRRVRLETYKPENGGEFSKVWLLD